METRLMDVLMAQLVESRTLVEVITHECDCRVERVHVGNSGLVLLRRNPDELGVTHVGFQLVGVNKLAHMCDNRDRPATIGTALEIVASLHPSAVPAVIDIAIPMAMKIGADMACI